MNKKEYALVINLDKDARLIVEKAWNLLINQEIKYISSRSALPHITILHGIKKPSTANLLIKEKIIPKTKKFNIESNGLGVFISKLPSIYIRWIINENIYKLRVLSEKTFKNKYKKNFSGLNWIPKSTIAFKDLKISQISKSLKKIKHINFNFQMKVEKLSLISYSIRSKEKVENEYRL